MTFIVRALTNRRHWRAIRGKHAEPTPLQWAVLLVLFGLVLGLYLGDEVARARAEVAVAAERSGTVQ